jgi:uncharacterized membrane protein
METLLGMFLIAGVLLIALAIPTIFKRIPPNPFYGFRVQQTLDSPELWYIVNEYAGKRLLIVGIVTVVVAFGLYFIPGLSIDIYAIICAVVVLGLLGVFIVQIIRYMNSIQRG